MKKMLRKKAGYFQSSRTLAFGLISMLPLLLGYEYLTLAATREHLLQVRNGADVILRTLLSAVGIHSPFYLGIGLVITIGAAVLFRRKGTRLRVAYFFYAIVESAFYALLLALVLTTATDYIMLSMGEERSFHASLMLALGAGVYEEIVFRLFLYGGMALVLTHLTRLPLTIIYLVCAALSSAVFSAAHYMGHEAFAWYTAVFRFLAGLLFCLIYHFRGLGIAGWSHALYDLFLIL
ncbi:MAG TPA: CPBP family intramembrane metalloprotease [bacterium]|nr:CPBP family intramembrane metalloprotease [bacterium]HOY43793.1 CPBP family intramembrane metalloprotease [bacterium]HPG83302.1 CPBP family intramembrane metalloprotease [bacterium]HPM58914.1 CPBP family intramembrane metalloprotease [bacterium]